MRTKITTLRSGIVIKDNRSLGCGIQIENQNTKFMSLEYSHKNGFYLNIKSFWLIENQIPYYFQELNRMQLALMEANILDKYNGL